MARILVVDNYDSFVHTLAQYLAELGAEAEVWRNDDPRLLGPDGRFDPCAVEGFDGVLLSPGPGTPEQAGVCVEAVRALAGRVPVFGVCLGLQAIAVAHGAVVSRAPELVHGKVSQVLHDGAGVFAGLPSPLTCTRYHSLAVLPGSLPDCLEVTGRTADGVVMGLRHREHAVEGVQFHPESVLTQGGHRMLAQWLVACGDADAPTRAEGLGPLVDLA